MIYRSAMTAFVLTLVMGGASTAWSQANRRSTAPSPTPPVTCTVAEFHALAMTTHHPKERADKALAWMQTNGVGCTPAQLTMIMSNRPTWMGTGDTPELAASISRLLEIKTSNDPGALERLYRPQVQSPVRRETAVAGPDAGTAGASSPAPVVASAPPVGVSAVVGTGLGLPGAAGMTGAAVALAPAGQGININTAAPLPEVDMSRKMPPPNEPLFSFPPELGTPMLNYFGKIRRQFVRSFFMENLSPGKCPEGMAWRTDRCEASFPVAWRFGERLPQGAKTFPVDLKLVEKLNFDPGYTFIRVGADILALERDTGKVADAVLNLGKI